MRVVEKMPWYWRWNLCIGCSHFDRISKIEKDILETLNLLDFFLTIGWQCKQLLCWFWVFNLFHLFTVEKIQSWCLFRVISIENWKLFFLNYCIVQRLPEGSCYEEEFLSKVVQRKWVIGKLFQKNQSLLCWKELKF